MSFATRVIPLLTLLAAPMCAPAQAADYETGTSLVCDTQDQAEQFVAAYTGDVQAALRTVNEAAHDPNACGMVNATYLLGNKVGTARHGDNAFEVVHILVVEVATRAGMKA